jgi:hypothetical protein
MKKVLPLITDSKNKEEKQGSKIHSGPCNSVAKISLCRETQ